MRKYFEKINGKGLSALEERALLARIDAIGEKVSRVEKGGESWMESTTAESWRERAAKAESWRELAAAAVAVVDELWRS